MKEKVKENTEANSKPSVTLLGTVEKVIPSPNPALPDKAEISVDGAEDLYREIRVDNTLQDAHGNPVTLKRGAHVEVTIEAEAHETTPKKPL